MLNGVYTCGHVNDQSSLTYQPLYNPFDLTLPAPSVRLVTPGVPTALAAVAMQDNYTDLYVASSRALYRFPYDAQQDGATGLLVLDDPMLQGVQRLYAASSGGRVIVWGLNQADQVFYVACDAKRVGEPTAWSRPLPIVQGVEQISPYINRVTDANTFFVHTGVGRFQKAVQSPQTTIWKRLDILLPGPQRSARKFSSYTTRIRATDENNMPVANAVLNVAAATRVAVTINGLSYLIGPEPLPITADASVALTIVEEVASLTATRLQVRRDNGSTIEINPMDKPLERAAALDSPEALKAAKVQTAAGATRPLVSSSASDADLRQAAAAIRALSSARGSLSNRGGNAPPPAPGPLPPISGGSPDALAPLEVVAGDLFSFLESVEQRFVAWVETAANDVARFFVKIGNQFLTCVLDGIEKIAGAIELVIKAIAAAIEDVIRFLEFLFEWDDIIRTKDVFKKILRLEVDHAVSQLANWKNSINSEIASMKHTIDAWAGLPDDKWNAQFAAAGSTVGASTPGADLSRIDSTPGSFLAGHLVNNGGNYQGPVAGGIPAGGALDAAFQAIEDQAAIIQDAIQRLWDELGDPAPGRRCRSPTYSRRSWRSSPTPFSTRPRTLSTTSSTSSPP